MDLDFEASDILYLTGAFLGALTVLYFGASYVLQLSPAMKSALLLVTFSIFFLEGYDLYSRDMKLLSNLSYVLAGVTYLVFLAYTSIKFSLTEEQILLLLGASSMLFTVLGYSVREETFEIAHRESRKILVSLAVLAAVFLVFDATGAQPEYEMQLKDTVKVQERRETALGVLQVSNDFLLSRNIELPEYSACIYTPNRTRGFVSVERKSEDIISGDSTREMNVTLDTPAREERNISTSTYPVEQLDSCPEEASQKKIVVVQEQVSELRLD